MGVGGWEIGLDLFRVGPIPLSLGGGGGLASGVRVPGSGSCLHRKISPEAWLAGRVPAADPTEQSLEALPQDSFLSINRSAERGEGGGERGGK